VLPRQGPDAEMDRRQPVIDQFWCGRRQADGRHSEERRSRLQPSQTQSMASTPHLQC
jgi:hypothetical protein